MKKLLYLLLSLVFVLSLSAVIACDTPTGKGDSGLKIRYIDGVYTVIDYVQETGVTSLTIDKVDGKEIGAIKKGAFSGNSSLTEIIVGSSVKEIGEGAFANMKKLEKITLPFVGAKADAVNDQRLFGYTFLTTEAYEESEGYSVTQNYSQSGTISLYLPNTLKTVNIVATEDYELPRYAFSGITRLEKVNLEGKITEIGDNAFNGCTGLKQVVVADAVERIGENAFIECPNLKNELGISDTASIKFTKDSALKEIDNGAFSGSKLTKVSLTKNVERIGENAFSNSAVKTLFLNENLKEIGNYAFYNATKLETVEMSANVEKIGVGAFENAKELVLVNVKEGNATDTKIYSSAFKNCVELKNIDLRNFKTLSLIDDDAFNGCTVLESCLYVGDVILGERVFNGTKI
ncbi:MAG: leucine-rich repeat domain-containing protein [Clostridiales bacterium]|nr:leucine-rich repeat domain-containing protein [Clostridiales bacterium]